MRDDDSPLRDIDMSAWEAPAPPADLADAVVLRMREAVAASPMTHLIQTLPSRRRWLLAGGAIAAAAVAAILIVIFGGERPDPSGHGSVTAERAQHLDIGAVGGDLDPGADLKWERDRNGVRVEQRKGAALWKVGADDKLVIETGAGASVEASGASLRVEVQMNPSDARMIGASGAAAAAVALVTVIVYEGHVNVTRGDQTANIAPGATFKIEPTKDAPTVGANVPAACDEVSCVLTNYQGDCCAKLRSSSHDGHHVVVDCLQAKADKKWQELLDCSTRVRSFDPAKAQEFSDAAGSEMRADIDREKLAEAVATGNLKEAKARLDRIAETSVYHAEAKAKYDAAERMIIDKLARQATDLASQHKCAEARALLAQTSKSYGESVVDVVRASAARCVSSTVAVAGGCDAEPHRSKATELVNMGQYAAGLAEFDKALACQPGSVAVLRLAYMSACGARNAARAQELFTQIPQDKRGSLAQICRRNGIDPTVATAVCNANDLHDQGLEAERKGDFAVAIEKYEASLQCRRDDAVEQRAFFASCNAKNATKARYYFDQLSSWDQHLLAPYCVNVVALKPLSATSNVCIPATLQALGSEYLNHGQYFTALAEFKKAVACKGGDTPAMLRLGYIAACGAGDAAAAHQFFTQIPAPQQGNVVQICLRNHIDPTKKVEPKDDRSVSTVPRDCDAEAYRLKGTEFVNMGQYGAALQQFKLAMKCGGSTVSLIRLAYMAACGAGDEATATMLFQQIPPDQQGNLIQICKRNHIDPTKPADCDADVYRTKGTELVNQAKYAEGLQQFRQAMQCKGGNTLAVIRLAYMAACGAGDAVTAKSLFAQIPPAQQGNLVQVCMRNHIDPTSSP